MSLRPARKAALPLIVVLLATTFFLAPAPPPAQADPGDVALVSASSTGTYGDDLSDRPSVSADGRYVAFDSKSGELVPGTTGNQVLRKDLETNELVLVSCNAADQLGNLDSDFASISADGRYVAFESEASNLVDPSTCGQQVFRKDLLTGEVQLVSRTADGFEGNSLSGSASISADGRYVAFESDAINLVADDTNGAPDIFRKDLETGALVLCSARGSGVQGNAASFVPTISADGRYVAFESDSTNLVTPSTSDRQIFRKDLETGKVELVSCDAGGDEVSNFCWWACISADGRYVAFSSNPSDKFSPPTIQDQVLRKDLQTGEIQLVSCNAGGEESDDGGRDPSISYDGRFVSFESRSTNLVDGDTNGIRDVFRKDMKTGAVACCSSNAAWEVGNGFSQISSISGDGKYVAFMSQASNLLSPVVTGQQVYRKELAVPYSFYFAEGYTGPGFQEYLCLGQPADVPLDVYVTFLFPGGTTEERTYRVPALSRFTVDVNAAVGAGKEVSIKCEADSPFIAERPMYFNYVAGGTSWSGGHDAVGASAPARTWYFAEGYTGPGFDEYICVLNPGYQPAELTFRFQTQTGEKVAGGLSVPARSRETFMANGLLKGVAYETSLKLMSDQPVVAERPMYFNYTGTGNLNWTGGHCVMGATSLSDSFFFAEGYTGPGFDEYLTIQNPGGAKITVDAVYQLGQGQGDPVQTSYDVPARSRKTVYINGPDGVGSGKDVSVYLTCATPFLAERPMYFDYTGTGNWHWTGGHCVIGAVDGARTWFFAEGYTGDGFEQWICIQNPGDSPAEVTITYYPEGGGVPIVREQPTIAANTRYTAYVNGPEQAGPGLSLSAKVTSDQPVICERPMYFDFFGLTGGHDVLGYTP